MFDKQAVVSPAKPADGPDPQVHDLLHLMTLTIPQLFFEAVAGYVGCYRVRGV